MSLLLAASCVADRGPGPFPHYAFDQGSFHVVHYNPGHTGLHDGQRWCEVTFSGAPFEPLGVTFDACVNNASPSVPAFVAFSKADIARWGEYVVHARDGAPVATKVGTNAHQPTGRWSADGRWYVMPGQRFDAVTGTMMPLPPLDGEFLELSPDGRELLTLETTGGEVVLRQVDLVDGSVVETRRALDRVPWARYDGCRVDGIPWTGHVWQAAQVEWEAVPGGWRIEPASVLPRRWFWQREICD